MFSCSSCLLVAALLLTQCFGVPDGDVTFSGGRRPGGINKPRPHKDYIHGRGGARVNSHAAANRPPPPPPPKNNNNNNNQDGADKTEISVYIESDGSLRFESGLSSNADIEASFIDGMSTIGWGILEVKISTNSNASDTSKMFAAGAAEGYLTSLRIYETYMNTINASGLWDFTNGPSNELTNFINQQKEYMNRKCNENSNDNGFWQYANLLNYQISGLQYGYNLTAKSNGVPTYNDSWPFEFLNLVGDLLDLMSALNPSSRLDYKDFTSEEWSQLMFKRGRCSALIKVTPELDNLFVGHSAWFIYQNTNRIYKHYIFPFSEFDNGALATEHMAFSSYPGYLESLDDFYIMDSGLAMLQTTNGIPNTTLYDLVTYESLYAWQRVRIANALSKSGKEWYNNLANENSGTYNNQYMIINYAQFEIGQPLANDFVWVIEQIPGTVAGIDVTDIVERGYWASYNVPAIEEIYNKSGYPDLVATQGTSQSYDLAPRARIFRRDANSVSNMEEYKAIMRYNNYKNDEIENNNPFWAICSRGDLTTSDAAPVGCYDTKVSNLTMLLNMQASVINGPTYDDLPPFDWTDWPTYPHAGIPNLMKFDWQWMQSQLA